MKTIYIVLTHTGTVLSKIIKLYTRTEFSHVSISLDKDLTQMYSFGRLNPYNPFIGGFVHEYIDKGTFKRFKKTVTKVYSLKVQDEQYKQIQTIITKMQKNANQYKFNIIGLFAVAIHVKIKSENSFYCAEFVKYVLDKAGINKNLPEIIRPEDFNYLKETHEEYKGLLQEYNTKELIYM